MNTAPQLAIEQAQSQTSQTEEIKEQIAQKQAQHTDADRALARPGQATWRSEGAMSGLEKALDALFKAQDHLNAAADQGGDGLAKLIDGINLSLKGLQREISQVIFRLGSRG